MSIIRELFYTYNEKVDCAGVKKCKLIFCCIKCALIKRLVLLTAQTDFCNKVGLGFSCVHVQFKTLFIQRDEEKHGHHFDLPLFFNMSNNNMSKLFLAPGGFSAEFVQVR